MQGEPDAVVGHAVLGKIVGADLLAAVARSDLRLALLGDFAVLPLFFGVHDSGTEVSHCLVAIFKLRALVLTRDDDSGRDVRDADGRVSCIDALSAGSRGTEGIDLQIIRI